MIFELREYQHTLKNDIRTLFQRGQRSVVLCSPTGSGKTVTFADICRETVNNGKSVMIVVDRKELIDQAIDKLSSYGLDPVVITGGVKYFEFGASCYVATVQTLKRRKFPRVDLLVVDECHKQIFDDVVETYRKKWDTFIIGATATPIRKGKSMNQLGSIYDHIVKSVEIDELIEQKYLSPAVHVGALIEMDGVKTRAGEYAMDDMFGIYDKPFLYDGLIEKWNEYAIGRKTIVFNINIEHSKKTCQAFRNAGISARHVDGNTPKNEREQILRDFKNGEFAVLCNVDILTTGYDEPSIECVVVNRRTKSVPLWLQMCGRGSRIHPGKHNFIILDMGGNTVENGFWHMRRGFSLWHKVRGGGVAPTKNCPDPLIVENDGQFTLIDRADMTNDQSDSHGCGAIVHASARYCPECGFVFPQNEREMKTADFSVYDKFDQPEIPKHLEKPVSEMTFSEMVDYQKLKGFKKGWLFHQLDPTNTEQLREFAKFMGYNQSWVWYAQQNIFNIHKQNNLL